MFRIVMPSLSYDKQTLKTQQIMNTELTNQIELEDEMNPEFLFNSTWNELLIQIVKGEIDPVQIAKKTLAGRGLTEANNYQYTTWKPRRR